MDDDYETVLFLARECFVYKVPARQSAAGYKAAEWGDMEAFLWKGRLRIIEKGGERCEIRMEDATTGELFALCPYDLSGTSVEPVLDSSRYFVLRVESEDPTKPSGPKRKAFIGMGFQDRSESFDFNVALQDWTKRTRAAKNAPPTDADGLVDMDGSGPSPHLPAGGKKDWTLKEGQTFAIKLPGGGGKKIGREGTAGAGSSSSAGGLGGFGAGGPLLPPPPSKRS